MIVKMPVVDAYIPDGKCDIRSTGHGRIGVSLPMEWLLDTVTVEPILALLRQQKVRSVELRTVQPEQDPAEVLKAADLLWDNGFQITVHGEVFSVNTAVSDVFTPLSALLPVMRQEKLNITVHPETENDVAMVTSLSNYILDHELPVTIALENIRITPDNSDSTKQVLEIVKTVNRKNVGICFDMGHYAYHVKTHFPEATEFTLDPDFLKHVIHTHIHGLHDMKTHFPLDACELPLKEILDLLSFEYFGIYNLELEFPRFASLWEPEEALCMSISYLQRQLPQCARLYDCVRTHFDGWFEGAQKCFEAQENTFSLIHSSSYLFHTAGCRWGMDIVFRNARRLAKTPAQAAELLKSMKVLVLSHGHADHYEESTLQMLAKNDTVFVVPDFLAERTLSLGIPREKLEIATPGKEIHLNGVTFLPFVSSHFRPDGAGVQEYGYHVSAPGCPSMVFPVDIRDFSKKEVLPPADYCFANVWLRDESCDTESWQPMLEPWARYMLHFSTGHIFITHLYEDGRPDDKMWRYEHALAVADAVRQLNPATEVVIPQPGQCIKLY